jgi:mono/diheme cytochrome c family protein
MQVKLIIGTIAFMLTMIIMGFVALREPARLEVYADAYEGRSIERGAATFISNCSTCHGVEGRAEKCFDAASGEPIGCKGRPLNNAELLCGTKSARMKALGWNGSKYDFIQGTVSAGRPWAGMPTWSENFGGPLQENQVRNVTLFVLNWEDEELCGAPTIEGPEWSPHVSELPAGNADNGQQLYEVTYACQGCHGAVDDESTANGPGPWLGTIATEGNERIEGYTAADYVYESVLKPNAFIAPECRTAGEPSDCPDISPMPGNFGERMTKQEMSDILSYVLGTPEFESNVEVEYPEGVAPPPAEEEP